MSDSPNPLRTRREKLGKSLSWLAQEIELRCGKRPSTASLSRMETGKQPLPVDLLPHIASATGLTTTELRPDLAGMFGAERAP